MQVSVALFAFLSLLMAAGAFAGTDITWDDVQRGEDAPPAPEYVVAHNKHRTACACGEVHLYVTRACVPIAFPTGFVPAGYAVAPARPPAQPFPDVEAAALRYRACLSAQDHPKPAGRAAL